MYPYQLPPQQILQANGKQSIDMIRLAPNSSVLIADQTAPIVWKCVSDSLGNVTAEPYDISPHKEETQEETITKMLAGIEERLARLEQRNEPAFKQYPKKYDTEPSRKSQPANERNNDANTTER